MKTFPRLQLRKLFLILLFVSCKFASAQSLIDPHATPQTCALHKNLHTLSQNHILFGHQHATEYGHGWSGDKDRSDVKSVAGSHPAVVGIDFMALSGLPDSVIERNKNTLIKQITDDYNHGCITTVSWHFSNPVSAGGFYWKDSVSRPAVKYIVPGGSHHQVYKKILSTIADVVKSTKAKRGEPVPMIFRPFHEFDGDWFWWGKSHCTAEEFKTLWRFTVSYLRDSLNVRNFIYAFSPDNKFNSEEEFLERYPGNEWVDLVGMDNYGDFGRDGKYDLEAAYKKLKIVSDFAVKNGKLAALTETGLESIPRPDWWTEVLLKTLQRSNLRLSYVLVWRNDINSPTHYYAPFPGHVSEKNFIEFYNSPYTLFANDLKNMSAPAHVQPVKQHGRLRVQGTQLVNQKGEPVVLHGMSFGWHNLWPRFYNKGAVKELVSEWKSNVVRASMGIELNDKGYLKSPAQSTKLMQDVIDACIRQGVYVIIDWHDHNIHTNEAKAFFAEMSKKYASYPNIIYEIFNEPDYETWAEVKKYSEEVISVIRHHDKHNIILVGSPRWNQDIHLPAADPIKGYDNLMYTMHFYAGTHKQWLRNRTDSAMAKGLPIFVSECAGMEATGNGPIDKTEWEKFKNWMDERKISWVAWSVSDKNETCSVLNPSASSNGNWKEEDIKEWGRIVKAALKEYGVL